MILTFLKIKIDSLEPQTPKSGRKWKKSKAAKQGSGSSSSSQHTPQSVLGVRLADCATAKTNEVIWMETLELLFIYFFKIRLFLSQSYWLFLFISKIFFSKYLILARPATRPNLRERSWSARYGYDRHLSNSGKYRSGQCAERNSIAQHGQC